MAERESKPLEPTEGFIGSALAAFLHAVAAAGAWEKDVHPGRPGAGGAKMEKNANGALSSK